MRGLSRRFVQGIRGKHCKPCFNMVAGTALDHNDRYLKEPSKPFLPTQSRVSTPKKGPGGNRNIPWDIPLRVFIYVYENILPGDNQQATHQGEAAA